MGDTKCSNAASPSVEAHLTSKLLLMKMVSLLLRGVVILLANNLSLPPAEMAGEWIVSEPEELHIPLPYGPQGLIYNRYVQKEAG